MMFVTQKAPYCLGYIDLQSMTWKCQDRGIIITQVYGNVATIGGYTPHLSDWAILINVNDEVEQSGSSSEVETKSSLPFYVYIIVAICGIGIIAGITAAIIIKKRQMKEEEEVFQTSKKTSSIELIAKD